MKAAYVNAQRAAILELHAKETPPADIALELGCSVSVVYKVIADPTPDKRGAREPRPPRIHDRYLKNIKVLASYDPTLSPAEVHAIIAERHNPSKDPPLPAPITVGRHLKRMRQAGEVPPRPPEADPLPDAEDVSVVAAYEQLPDDAASLRTELAVLRSLLKQSLRETLLPAFGPRARQRLRQHTASLVRDIALTLRADAAIRPKPAAHPFALRHLEHYQELLLEEEDGRGTEPADLD